MNLKQNLFVAFASGFLMFVGFLFIYGSQEFGFQSPHKVFMLLFGSYLVFAPFIGFLSRILDMQETIES